MISNILFPFSPVFIDLNIIMVIIFDFNISIILLPPILFVFILLKLIYLTCKMLLYCFLYIQNKRFYWKWKILIFCSDLKMEKSILDIFNMSKIQKSLLKRTFNFRDFPFCLIMVIFAKIMIFTLWLKEKNVLKKGP